MTPAEAIRAARTRAGLSQARAGWLVAVTKQTISNWETGQSLPRDLDELGSLADQIKMTPTERACVTRAMLLRDATKGLPGPDDGIAGYVTVRVDTLVVGLQDEHRVRVTWHDE